MTYRDPRDAKIEKLEAELADAEAALAAKPAESPELAELKRERRRLVDELRDARQRLDENVRLNRRWWAGRIMTAITAAGLLAGGGFLLSTCHGCPPDLHAGYVVGHEFVPEHTDTTYIQSGKALIPITNTIPNAWYVYVAVNGDDQRIEVDQETYRTPTGAWLCVERPCPEEPR